MTKKEKGKITSRGHLGYPYWEVLLLRFLLEGMEGGMLGQGGLSWIPDGVCGDSLATVQGGLGGVSPIWNVHLRQSKRLQKMG